MSVVSHSSVVIGVAVATFVSVLSSHPRWLFRVAERQAMVRATLLPPEHQTTEDREQREREALMARFQAKHRVVGEVIRGELTLTQAGAAFRRINRDFTAVLPQRPSPIAEAVDTAPVEVLLWVEGELRARPHPHATELLRRLEAELHSLAGRA